MADKPLVVALGGNAIIRAKEQGTLEEQERNARQSLAPIARIIAAGHDVVLTHGNGPIVGNILLRNEAARSVVPAMPLFICGADSQGGIGFMMQQVLGNELAALGLKRSVATVVTQVLVDAADPAFREPTKPIGPFFSASDAHLLRVRLGWSMTEDSGRGFRRVAPSPAPREIIELPAIRALLAVGVTVIAVGGGGIPVMRDASGTLRGVEAVVDKDRSAVLLARELGAEALVFLTAVPAVLHHYGEPDEAPIHRISVAEVAREMANGEFAAGSMGPKIEAAIQFLSDGGEMVLITNPENLEAALEGKAGTRITRSGAPAPLLG
jgi:carbamate kinase